MLYEYKCQKCGYTFDKFRAVSDRNMLTPCKKCGKPSDRLITSEVHGGVTNNVLDARKNKIWFPEDGKPYYDRQLGRKFNTITDKQKYMANKEIVMDGSTGKKQPKRGSDYF